MPKSNVTVFLEVFNEETRIESCLRSFSWADELIVFDKHSTDRTLEIAKRYATEVVTVPYTQASENIVQNYSGRASSEWVLFITASSLIHPLLVDEIVKLTTDRNFHFDVVGMPYGMYAFGINDRKSPWSGLRKYTLIRNSALKLSSVLHHEIGYASTSRVYNMPLMGKDEVLFHCTHKDAADFFNRTDRYTSYEAKNVKSSDRNRDLKNAFVEILKSVFTVLFRRRTFLMGWDGVALSLAYICNFIMKFIYVWDEHRENGDVVYPQIRRDIDKLWEERNAK
ncbi:MAG: glycosyltransferase [Methylomicrobium sp.]|nr:glycosyltransferase [Methylomicrobium sp.]